MRQIGLLVLSVVVTWAGVFIAVRPKEYKQEVKRHPIGGSPIWVMRVWGACLTAGGVWIFYKFLLS
jgi:hypothetical protein